MNMNAMRYLGTDCCAALGQDDSLSNGSALEPRAVGDKLSGTIANRGISEREAEADL